MEDIVPFMPTMVPQRATRTFDPREYIMTQGVNFLRDVYNERFNSTRPGSHRLPVKRRNFDMLRYGRTRGGRSGGGGYIGKPYMKKGKRRRRRYMRGRKRRYKKKYRTKKRKYFFTRKEEDGGILDGVASKAIYVVGTTTPITQLMNQFAFCLMKQLFKMRSIYIDDFRKTISSMTAWYQVQVEYSFYPTADTSTPTLINVNTFTQPSSPGTTFIDIVDDLGSSFEATFATNKRKLESIALLFTATSGASPDIYTISADEFYVHVCNYLTIQIQNTSLAASGTDTSEATNVTSNPLVGKHYYSYGNGFKPKVRRSQTKAFTTDNGFIATNTSSLLGNNYDKPPVGSVFDHKVSTRNIEIGPGAIMAQYAVHKQTYNISKFLLYHADDLASPNEFNKVGKAIMIGLERKLDNRSDSSIRIGYEYNSTLKCGYSYNPKTYVQPLIIDG